MSEIKRLIKKGESKTVENEAKKNSTQINPGTTPKTTSKAGYWEINEDKKSKILYG